MNRHPEVDGFAHPRNHQPNDLHFRMPADLVPSVTSCCPNYIFCQMTRWMAKP